MRNHLEQQKGRARQIEDDLARTKRDIEANKKSLHKHEEAREVIRTVGLATQQQLTFHISDITTLALEAIYREPYKLSVEFVQRRNKTECDLTFERDGNKIDPMSASGGGAVNIASFALRIASWSMQRPRSRSVIILDEPFVNLSADLVPKASEMLRQISKKLELQLIIVTHSDYLMDEADKVFRVTKRKGVSQVTC